MTSPPVTILGLSSTTFNPGFFGEVKYASGSASASSVPVIPVVVGTKLSTGTAVADQDVKQIFSSDDADTFFGAGSEIALMCYSALRVPGVTLLAAAAAEAAGAVAASITVTFTGATTGASTYRFRINGTPIEFSVASGTTNANVALAMQTAVNSRTRLPVTASVSTGVVTLTLKSKGARGNATTFWQDTSGLLGTTVVVAGGATAMSGGRFRFAGGTGTESPANVISVLSAYDVRYVALAQNDITNLTGTDLWRDSIQAKNGALVGKPALVVLSDHGDAIPTGLTTALNDPLFQVVWGRNLEAAPCESAAALAALRAVTNATDPGASFSGVVLKGLFGQTNPSDNPSTSVVSTCLTNGITPLTTETDNTVRVVRAITTKFKTGTLPDYSTLDVSQAYVPQYVRIGVSLLWRQFKLDNPRVQDDPDADDKLPEAGVAYPRLWTSVVTNYLKSLEQTLDTGAPPILINVDNNPVVSGYDKEAKRIVSLMPCVVAPNNEQQLVSIRQVV